ncbi:hypothetical protein BKA93DRAFT_877309 [Sparassis latifolia]
MAAPAKTDLQARKRIRLASDSEESNIHVGDLQPWGQIGSKDEPQRHAKLWFDDGNVILVAGRVAVRVHAGLISCDSLVIRTILKPHQHLLQTSDLPTIHLTDSASDLEALLWMMYDGRMYFGLTSDPVEFSVISSLIRLGHKYKIADIRDNALQRLHSCFPTNFEDWCTFNADGSSYITMQANDAIGAVNLARLTRSDTILPSALYACCCLSTRVILHGVRRADGFLEKLSSEDIDRCVEGRLKLMEANTRELAWVLDMKEASPKCKDKETCARKLRKLPGKALLEAQGRIHARAKWRDLDQLGVCSRCLEIVKRQELRGRRKVWLKLPSYMGVTVEDWQGCSIRGAENIFLNFGAIEEWVKFLLTPCPD